MAGLGAVAFLITAYAPLSGLDHLHLHVEAGVEFVHDHLHVGHHEHHHHLHHHPHGQADGGDHEPDDGSRQRTTVVTFAQSAQNRPPAVQAAVLAAAVDGRLWAEAGPIPRRADASPPWNPRAPPV